MFNRSSYFIKKKQDIPKTKKKTTLILFYICLCYQWCFISFWCKNVGKLVVLFLRKH